MKLKNLKSSNITLKRLKKLSKTKGWPLSIIGGLVYITLKICGFMPKNYHGISCFEIGKRWGGVSLGWFFITGKENTEYTKNHEVGHIVQNAEVGGVTMLWFSICSVCRYWKRKLFRDKTRYDLWWFEGQATMLGDEFINRIKEGETTWGTNK